MLPLRLVIIRNIRAGTVWSHVKFSTSRDGGEKEDSNATKNSSQSENVLDKNPTDNKDIKIQEQTTQSEYEAAGQDKSRLASLKLNELLHSMLKEETTRKTPSKAENLVLTQPKQRKKEKKEPTISQPVTIGASVVQAVEEVARELGGDERKTQAELLDKVTQIVGQVEAKVPPNKEETPPFVPTKSPINLSELIVGMKIDRSQPTPSETFGRAHQVRTMLAAEPQKEGQFSISASMLRRQSQPRQQYQQRESAIPAGLNDGVALGIFARAEITQGSTMTCEDMWSKLQERELQLVVTHPPVNIFEEMILWTNQGKLWNFPINNEQGLEEESNVPFSEHVFLECHIEDWCPKRGPVRHFMELVCVGLSKNPYITVQEKKNHIAWYKEYFLSKEAVLKEAGAMS